MTVHRRLLGIDYGSKRIGVAVSDPLRVIATGVTVLTNSSRIFDEIQRLVNEFDVETIVVGMPLTLKGERGTQAAEVEDFMRSLTAHTGCEVIAWDERFTSQTAHDTMRIMGTTRKQRRSKPRIDLMASALILQGYLDAVRS